MLKGLEELPEKLEDLYDHMILQIQKHKRRTPEFCRLVLSAATLAYRPLDLTKLAIVSGLPAEISGYRTCVQEVVALCGSFLTIKDSVVYLIHQSVKDYLTGRRRQTIFPSGPGQVHRTMFVQSVEALSTRRLHRNMYNLQHLSTTIDNVKVPKPDPLASMQYSCIHWAYHFCDVNPENSCSETKDLERIDRFIRSVFLYWLEAAALLRSMPEGITSIRRLETFLKAQSCKGRVMSLISDAVRFSLHSRYIIENAPLQAYISALIFSPFNSVIRKEFSHEEPAWVNLKPIIESNWSPCMQTLEGHSDSVVSVAFSPDGRQIASGSHDGTIKIWDCMSGACAQTLDHVGSLTGEIMGFGPYLRSVAFSPDGRQISSADDITIMVWDCTSGACTLTLDDHDDSVSLVGFSSDGQQITSVDHSTIRVWDCTSGACTQTFEHHSKLAMLVAFSPDGQQIALSLRDGTIKIWDCILGACTQTFEGHSSSVRSLAFSPDDQQIASASDNGTIKVWDYMSGTCAQTLKAHRGLVTSVAFSPDSQQIVSASDDSTIKVWDCISGTCMQTFEGHRNSVRSVAFSPDGIQIASASDDGTIKVWDCTLGAWAPSLEGHSGSVKSVVFSPDGQQIASASQNSTILVWDCTSGTCMQTLKGHRGSVTSVAFSPDSQQIASASGDSTIKVWDCTSGACARTLNHSRWVRSIAFSPDGKQIASASDNGTIKVWDCTSGACVQTLNDSSGYRSESNSFKSVAFSRDGQQIVSGLGNGTIKVWDCTLGACTQTLEGHSGSGPLKSVGSVAFSPNGLQIVSASHDHTIKVWDCTSGACAQTLEGHGYIDDIVAVETTSTSYLRVLTDQGWIGLPTGQDSPCLSQRSIADSQPTTAGEDDEHGYGYKYKYGYGFSTDGRWICRREQYVLWLPPNYRPSSSAIWCFPSHESTTSDGLFQFTVALGCPSGRVIVLGLTDDESPWTLSRVQRGRSCDYDWGIHPPPVLPSLSASFRPASVIL